jgi:putative membrane protein
MKTNYFTLFVKGIAMGTANVIPGVSGGTIALITGIYERLINAIKSFNIKALKLLLQFKFKEFAKHTDLVFLVPLMLGLVFAVLSLAKIFAYLFAEYPVYIWAYFFGLVLASVYFVGKTVERWNTAAILSFIIGAAIAIAVSIIHPAAENSSPFYVFINGVIAIVSMILPGLSGSFVLILLGNYQLIAINAINNFDLSIIIPFALGAGIGLVLFSHFLSWLFKSYKNQTIALLTGFILGSLGVLWPWKNPVYLLSSDGATVVKHGKKVIQYYDKTLPQDYGLSFYFAVALMLIGVLSIFWIEKYSATQEN